VVKLLINTLEMITICWNQFGIHVLVALPEKTSFDAEYLLDYALSPTEELPVMHADAIQKQTFVIHRDNSPIHTSKAALHKIASIWVKIAPHLPYSPHLALSDFFLFSCFKQKIFAQKFVSADDLLEAIRDEFEPLSRSFLENVFDDWMIHLQTFNDY
jgi:hypothetical protein